MTQHTARQAHHCHFTYSRPGMGYLSPLYWPTLQDAQAAAGDDPATVFVSVHASPCTCDTPEETPL